MKELEDRPTDNNIISLQYLLSNSVIAFLPLKYFIHQFVEKMSKGPRVGETIELQINLISKLLSTKKISLQTSVLLHLFEKR